MSKKQKIPKVLYHYCSVETFYSIIKNKSIWLSDISKSNDSKELNWIKERGYTYVLNCMVNYVEALERAGKLVDAPFDKYHEAEKVIKFSIENETEKCWVFCLSEKVDDLGQWRGYSQDASGIAIGIKTEYLLNLVGDNRFSDINDEKLHFDKVSYYKDSDSDAIFNSLLEIERGIEDLSNDEFTIMLKRAVVTALMFSPYYKSDYFKGESEWRLTLSMSCNEIHNGRLPDVRNEYMSSSYDYSLIKGKLVSHIELIFDNFSEAISSIWLGPKCELSEREVKLFLISKGYLKDLWDDSIKVYNSNASYR